VAQPVRDLETGLVYVNAGTQIAQIDALGGILSAKLIGAFRVELYDKAPVMPVGVVTTQPDRSPMFRITRR